MIQHTTTTMPSKRPATDAPETTKDQLKRLCSAVDNISEEWVCPITCELPIDPVMAEDGCTYERCGIEKHIEWRDYLGEDLKSPTTNVPMGPRLLSNVQAKNTIEKLVRTGVLVGDKAERWEKRLTDENTVRDWQQEAERGNVKMMYKLGCVYVYGQFGCSKDINAAYAWFKRGAEMAEGNPDQLSCYTQMGQFLLVGAGVKKNVAHGMYVLTDAAHKGSSNAAMLLGDIFYMGFKDIPRDAEQAKRWYTKVTPAEYLQEKEVAKAAERLRKLAASASSASSSASSLASSSASS